MNETSHPGHQFRFLLKISLIFVFSICSLILSAERVFIPERGYSLNPPAGWTMLDDSDPTTVSFTNPSHSAVFQVMIFPGDSFRAAAEMYQQISAQLEAEGDQAPFVFSGRDSIFSNLSFSVDRYKVRGYLIFINDSATDFLLLSFSTLEKYEEMHDLLLSCLDSFSLDGPGELLPGPVSQFYYPFPGRNPESCNLTINGETIRAEVDKMEFEAAQVVIEREARILASYNRDKVSAWRRYFKVIYRDNYHRLDKIYSLILPPLISEGTESWAEELPMRILSWIQSFTYNRSGSLADLIAPISAAYTASGDCDSRVLLYIILLHHFDVDSILLVSSRYSHSVAGLDIPGKGARISFEGKDYLIAETTQSVDIGLIHRDMADASGWIAIRLGDY